MSESVTTNKRLVFWTIALKNRNGLHPMMCWSALTRAKAIKLFNDDIVVSAKFKTINDFPNYQPVKIAVEILDE